MADDAVSERMPIHEEHRQKIVAEIPDWYRPSVHLAIPTVLGIGVAVAAACCLRGVTWVDALALPITIFIAFGFEWRAHKDILHKRKPGLSLIYERHELKHHVIYTDRDMAMRSGRELWLILMPAYAIVLVFLMVAPLAAVVAWLTSFNAAMFVLISSMAFFLSYEWLHMSYHLPETTLDRAEQDHRQAPRVSSPASRAASDEALELQRHRARLRPDPPDGLVQGARGRARRQATEPPRRRGSAGCVSGRLITPGPGSSASHDRTRGGMRTATKNALVFGVAALATGAVLWFVGQRQTTPLPVAGGHALDAIPAGAILVATADLDALRASPIAGPFLMPGREIQGVGKIKDVCGFDPLDKIKDVAVGIPASGDSGEFGLAASGDFQEDAILDCAARVIQKRGGQPVTVPMGSFRAVHDGASSSGGEIAVRKGGPLLLGGGAYLRAMIEAAEGKTPTIRASKAHAALIGAVGDGSLRLTFVLSPEQRRALAEGLERASSVLAGGLALTLGPVVKVHAVLECPSAEACADVAHSLVSAKQTRAADLGTRIAGFGPVLERLSIEAEGAMVHARVDVSPEEAATLIDMAVKLGGFRHPMPSDTSESPRPTR